MSDIRDWLEALALGEYAEAFEAEKIDPGAVPELTEDDLKELGLPMGPRRIVLKAAKILATSGEKAGRETGTPSEAVGQRREAERRQLTVLFCDMVGSTALSEKLDPEDLRDVMRAYQDACAGAIHRFDGHIAQTLGDGLMVYFGYPIAHEDDPQRAIRAGLDILSRVATLEADIAVRVGVQTGLVVAGETPNIAARLQGLAEPGTVVVGERTRRLAGGVFDYEDLGARDLKGLSEPMPVFRVAAERAAASRFEATHRGGLTPFVGRDEEIGLLLRRWEEAKEGDGQVVLLSGEPGIGKSRIADTFRERIAGEAHTRVQYQCSPFHANSAFYPIINQLERAADFDGAADPDAKLDKLEALIEQTGDAASEAVALLASLMSLPIDRYPALNMSPQKQKERTLEVLAERIAAQAKSNPVLIVFEDVHWIDPTTLEALDHVIAAVARTRVFLLITFRPEFTPQWGGHSHVSAHTLNRLGRRVSSALVGNVTGEKPLPSDLTDHIVAKTDGVPLFIEELTKAVIESGIVVDTGDGYALSGAIDTMAIPDTLHDSLMARLDRLIPVKEVAQIGAAIGREFSYQLVAALSPMSEPDLDAALDKLIDSELVHRRGTPPNATYTFKHALVQDAAYNSLLKRDRQALHKEIAETLLKNLSAIAETEPEILAHHYSEAGSAKKAIPLWLKAGELAIARAGHQEGLAHLERGLTLLKDEPNSAERAEIELSYQMNIGSANNVLRGWSAAEVKVAYGRARELVNDLTDRTHGVNALLGLFYYYLVAGDVNASTPIIEEAAELAEAGGISDQIIVAQQARGQNYLYRGHFGEAAKCFEASLSRYDRDKHAYLSNACLSG